MPATTALTLKGDAQLTLYSAVKDFKTDKKGTVVVYLRDCTAAGACTTIASGQLAKLIWSGGSGTWVPRTIDLGVVDYVVPAGNRLEVKVLSDAEDMWFAYDTVATPSALTLN